MRLSIDKWLCIQSIVFLILISPLSQTMAQPSFFGFKGAIGGVALPRLRQYAAAHGYNNIKTPFCHPNLEGGLYLENPIWNHMSYRSELGPRYTYVSFTGMANQNNTKQPTGLHCIGGHFSMLLYLYPRGRFADNGSWNGHIGWSGIYESGLKDIPTSIKEKAGDKFSIFATGLALGVGFEYTSGLQIECRYRWLAKSIKSPDTTVLHGIALSIGYRYRL